MAEFTVVPTVPTFILGVSTGPLIPHLGAQHWGTYAEKEVRMQLQWLGYRNVDYLVERIFLTTYEGGNPEIFGVKHAGEVHNGTMASYISMHTDALRKAVRGEHYVEARYGKYDDTVATLLRND
jgi:hypothetical protein